MLRSSQLTKGEKLYIHRKRLRFTQFQMAVRCGVCLAEYRSMELDEEGTTVGYHTIAPIKEREVYATLRRRQGITKSELAREIGVSAYWLGRMEEGAAPVATLAKFWEKQNAVG
jgi:hypothetical protein